MKTALNIDTITKFIHERLYYQSKDSMDSHKKQTEVVIENWKKTKFLIKENLPKGPANNKNYPDAQNMDLLIVRRIIIDQQEKRIAANVERMDAKLSAAINKVKNIEEEVKIIGHRTKNFN